MAVYIHCDLCGEQLTAEEVFPIIVITGEEEDSMSFTPRGVERTKKQERFEACRECALQLVVALKQSQLRIKRGDRRVE